MTSHTIRRPALSSSPAPARTRISRVGALLVFALAPVQPVVAESAVAVVRVSAMIEGRTSLRVSGSTLGFPSRPDDRGAAVVEFSAGARTRTGGEVVLSVERLDPPDSPSAVRFAGNGEGTTNGVLADRPRVVARWSGSGMRRGRIAFTRAPEDAGTAAVPLRFSLTAP
jgi:hypothetical protein